MDNYLNLIPEEICYNIFLYIKHDFDTYNILFELPMFRKLMLSKYTYINKIIHNYPNIKFNTSLWNLFHTQEIDDHNIAWYYFWQLKYFSTSIDKGILIAKKNVIIGVYPKFFIKTLDELGILFHEIIKFKQYIYNLHSIHLSYKNKELIINTGLNDIILPMDENTAINLLAIMYVKGAVH